MDFKPIVVMLLAASLLAMGCLSGGNTTPQPEATINPTLQATATPTSTIQPTAVSTATASSTPQPTAPAATALPSAPQAQGITTLALSAHSSQDDCWVSFEGKAYDITSLLPFHPDGGLSIAPYCGTTGFEQAFVAKHGQSKMRKFFEGAVMKGDFTG